MNKNTANVTLWKFTLRAIRAGLVSKQVGRDSLAAIVCQLPQARSR